ncbi:Na+/H+ antiporter subunit D [Propionibacteriaceae bacterium G1746]|uniref:Na+/H+ antiporter subunit D n=1 Tax=Aestuariimicrobium sp. G57 TaxID=3418485 RepID=UPI003C267935
MNNLLPLPVLLPMFGAAITLIVGRRPRVQRAISIAVLVAVVAVVAWLAITAHRQGVQTLWFGAWPGTAGIALVADRLSALMLLVASLVTLGVLIYSGGPDSEELSKETPVSIFHPTFLLLCSGVSNAFLAGDLFNLFVGFEILLFASYVLLTMGATRPRIRAASIYVVVNLVSSALFLILLGTVYSAVGTVNLAQLAQRIPALPDDVQVMIQALMLTIFGLKAAIFPLSAWLPDSYPTAPAPVTAVFAGLLTKVGIYAILRTQTVLFPHRPLTEVLLVLAALSMLVGIMGAIAQSELKRMLSFTLVSHIGYMLLGIALGSVDGLTATIYYTSHHITIQTTLFLVVGLVGRVAGSTSLERISGLVAVSPLLATLFFVPAMNLSGIPPFSGFIGKIGLLQASLDFGGVWGWTMVTVALLTSLLTLYAIAKAWNRAFWGEPELVTEGSGEPGTMPRSMVGATVGMIALTLALTFGAGWLYDYCQQAAIALTDGDYVRAVMEGRS